MISAIIFKTLYARCCKVKAVIKFRECTLFDTIRY